MAAKILPDLALLRQIFRYDAEQGVLYHATRPLSMFKNERYWRAWHTKYSGKPISNNQGRGYSVVSIAGPSYPISRVVYKLHHGIEPPAVVDHVNGNTHDNRIANLRGATWAQNLMNRPRQSNNKTGYKGVYWCSHFNRFVAQICANGRVISLGKFKSAEAARDAYAAAARKYHGEFAKS